MPQEICKPLFYTDFIFVLQGSQLRIVLKKKKKSKKNYVYKFWY